MVNKSENRFDTLDFAPVSQEAMTPEQYLRMPENQRDNIDSVRVEPPVLGKNTFGRVVVSYSDPIYTMNPANRHDFK